MKKKISIKNLYLIALISIGLIGLGIGSTYAVFTASATIDNPIAFTSTLSYTSDVIETVEVTIAPGETKYTILDITNTNDTALNYAIWYIDEGKDIDLGADREQTTENMCPGITTCTGLANGNTAYVGLYIRNNTSSTIIVTVGVSASSGDIVLDDNMTIFPSQSLPESTTPTTYTAQIIRTVDGANQATVATRSIIKGSSDAEAVVVEGTLFTAQYTSISCTNGQTATVTVTEGDYYQIAHVTVNNITADTVCTVAFNTE